MMAVTVLFLEFGSSRVIVQDKCERFWNLEFSFWLTLPAVESDSAQHLL